MAGHAGEAPPELHSSPRTAARQPPAGYKQFARIPLPQQPRRPATEPGVRARPSREMWQRALRRGAPSIPNARLATGPAQRLPARAGWLRAQPEPRPRCQPARSTAAYYGSQNARIPPLLRAAPVRTAGQHLLDHLTRVVGQFRVETFSTVRQLLHAGRGRRVLWRTRSFATVVGRDGGYRTRRDSPCPRKIRRSR